MSNASIFLSKIVVKTIDNIEKTVKYIYLISKKNKKKTVINILSTYLNKI